MTATFRMRIAGVDREMVERHGDISQTGIYIECGEDIGRPGSVQTLLIAFPRGDEVVHVLARVIRVATVNDLWQGERVAGVALEFLLADSDDPVTGSYSKDRAAKTLERLVGAVARQHLDHENIELDHPLDAEVSGAPAEATASIQNLGLQSMTLETTWAIPEGETVHIDVPSPDAGTRIRMRGRATHTKGTADGRYSVQVEVTGVDSRDDDGAEAAASRSKRDTERTIWSAEGTSMSAVVGSLLDQALVPRPPSPSRPERSNDLFGDLARIPVPSLLTLLESDRLEGTLCVRHADGPLMIYLRAGRVVDAEGRGRSPRGAIAALLPLREGEFDFTVETVDREDRFNLPMTALVLDVIRAIDEANRPD